MPDDFLIRSRRGELRISAIPRRVATIFAPPVRFGMVVGTFASVPYVHLHLEARRRFYPHVPVLVHDDASPKQGELECLCEAYGCEFEANDARRPACIGDISCVLGGLLWAQEERFDILVKMSRRFLPLMDWTSGLQDLALDSQYPTFSSATRSFGFGFRSECMGMAVKEWIGDRVHEQLATIAMASETPLVESVMHNIARRLASFRCERAMRWDETHGPRPSDRDGYAPWDFMGIDRCERYHQFLWHDWASPEDYFTQAREWGLPYCHEDFIDPNQGFGCSPGEAE